MPTQEVKQLQEGKAEMRKRLAALPFTEKIRILEKLRDRSPIIAKAGLRKKVEPKIPK